MELAQVRRDAIMQADTPKRGAEARRDDDTGCRDAAETATDYRGSHRNTRGSSGNSPMRSMTRYAASDTAPPTMRIVTPAGVS